MILLVSDTHRNLGLQKLLPLRNYPLQKDDLLIILGDTGIVWDGGKGDQSLQKWYRENIPCKVLFLDGNHDNIQLLNKLPVSMWNGGKVQKVNTQISHLIRGQIYTIGNTTFFVMGGGRSVDKHRLTENVSWWPEEMPQEHEYEEGLDNLKTHGNKVDYILTHEGPARFVRECIPEWAMLEFGVQKPNPLNLYLDKLYDDITFTRWYWGHYHDDVIINNKCKCIYNNIIELRTQ